MQIKKGIMLHQESIEGYDHIAINDGVVPHAELEKFKVVFNGHSFFPGFERDAFLPKRVWRGLQKEEIQTLRPTNERTDANTVYIGNIPDSLAALFGKLELWQCRTRAEVFEKFKSAVEITVAINQAMDIYLRSRSGGKPFNFHYLGTNLPNLEVVACDTTYMPAGVSEEDKKYMGVHNDGTKYVPIHSLYRSGNRFTINLGKESRYFLFVNLTLPQAFNMLKQKLDVKAHKIDITNIAKTFFRYFPDYPVIKVEQKPYQYYIAPTDNCFHDGSTLGTKELDIIVVYFGAFRL